MTKYEQSIADGFPPMKTMEWMLLQMMCEDILKNGAQDEYDRESSVALMMEIEHFYKDDQTSLNLIKQALNYIEDEN